MLVGPRQLRLADQRRVAGGRKLLAAPLVAARPGAGVQLRRNHAGSGEDVSIRLRLQAGSSAWQCWEQRRARRQHPHTCTSALDQLLCTAKPCQPVHTICPAPPACPPACSAAPRAARRAQQAPLHPPRCFHPPGCRPHTAAPASSKKGRALGSGCNRIPWEVLHLHLSAMPPPPSTMLHAAPLAGPASPPAAAAQSSGASGRHPPWPPRTSPG